MNDQPANPPRYEIEIQGHLGNQWTHWFERLVFIRNSDGTTTLSGSLRDQAALHGVPTGVRDLGPELISVSRWDAGQLRE
jgi:hypothetical protein